MNERITAQDQKISDLKRIIESVASNAAASNTLVAQDTESPGVVSVRSSETSQSS
jgi:predicted RNase H-like nuclease